MSEERMEQGAPRSKTVLGADCRMSGELCLDNDAIIMGQFEGTLRVTGTLELAASAQVRGTVVAGTLRLAGKVEGDVIAEEGVDLLAGSELLGELFTGRINVEDGALFQGQVCVSPNAMDAAAERLEALEAGASPVAAVDDHAPATMDDVDAADEAEPLDAPAAAPQVQTMAQSMNAAIQRRRSKVLSSARRVAATAHGHG
ncbi:MAG: polymer-forming cytoskeletal protein [Phycisphaeraceae bacterium]